VQIGQQRLLGSDPGRTRAGIDIGIFERQRVNMNRDIFQSEKLQPLAEFFFPGGEGFIFTAKPDNTFFSMGENSGHGQFLRGRIDRSDFNALLAAAQSHKGTDIAVQRCKKGGTENRVYHVLDYSTMAAVMAGGFDFSAQNHYDLNNMKRLTLQFPMKDFFVAVFADQVYVVGGTVRDFLLYGQAAANQDVDLLVCGRGYDEIAAMLKPHGKTDTVGKSFAVLKFTRQGKTFDIAIPRRDQKKDGLAHGHKNFRVEAGPQVTLEEDLSRRDFTCNSVAVRLKDGSVVDPHQGLKAIAEKRIIMTSPASFSDDPLRILRAARFAAVHDFAVDKAIYLKAKKIPLSELSAERIMDELFRLLLESAQPSAGLQEYFRLTVLEKLFPELASLTLTIQDAYFHPEQDEQGHHSVWAHTLITVDIVKKLAGQYHLDEERSLTLLLAALLHDCGKAATTTWEFKRGRMTVTSAFHDSRGSQQAEALLTRLRIETRQSFPLKKTILRLVQQHHRIYELYRNREAITFKAVARAVKDMDGEDLLLLLLDFADRRSREPQPLAFGELDEIALWFSRKKAEYQISRDTIQPLIQGRDLIALGVVPGRQMGIHLKKLYDLQLDGAFLSRAQGLKLFKNTQKKKPANPTKGRTKPSRAAK
jgi:tRNA nucleotidyltransferase/poly(A) polymerase